MRIHWVLVALGTLACSESASIIPPRVVSADAIEHDVWATVISDLSSDFQMPPVLLSANALQFHPKEELSSQLPQLQGLADSVPGLDSEIIASFHRRNADMGSIEAPLQLGVPYHWITREQEIAGRAAGHPSDLYGVDRHILIGLSHAGFTRDYHWAILYRTYHCGGLCGAGAFLLLERNGNDTWRVRQSVAAYIE